MTVTANIKRGFPHYSEDDAGIRTYDLEYEIITTAGEGVRVVAASLPQRGAFYSADGEIDLQAIANSPRITRDVAVNAKWNGSQTFSTKRKTDCTENEDDDPLQEPAVVTWLTRVHMRGFDKDLDGNSVATSAGEPYETTETEDYLLGCHIVRNVTDWNPITALRYYGKMNSDTFRIDRWTFQKETARIVEWTGQKVYHQDCDVYYQSTMQFEFLERTRHDGKDVSGWDLQLLDAGHSHIDNNGNLTVIRVKGSRPFHPVRLDGFGSQAEEDDPDVFNRFRRIEKTNFAGLFSGIKW